MELIIHDFELPLLHPFTISRETITVQPSVIVELRDGELILYRGDYSYFLQKKEEEKSILEEQMALAAREAKRLANRDRQRKRKKKK